jgi:hypothetical protein
MPATPVAISTLSRTAGVVTLSTGATPHNLIANQGFSINGVTLDATFNFNGVVLTVPDTTHITYNQAGNNSSIGVGGTIVAAKEVIVLSTNTTAPNLNVSVLFWLTTTQGVPNTSITSFWSGASTQEIGAIRAGVVVETGINVIYPTTYTKAQIQADLAARWSAAQANLASAVQPGQFYGGFFDGNSWSF